MGFQYTGKMKFSLCIQYTFETWVFKIPIRLSSLISIDDNSMVF